MKTEIKIALEQFADRVNAIFNNNIKSVFTYGSAVYDDVYIGYSDLDFLVIINGDISENDFKALSEYRKVLKLSNNPYFKMLEGGFVSYSNINYDKKSNAISWGGSGEKLNKEYYIWGFSLKGMIDSGILICGEDIRNEFQYPTHEIMMKQIDELVDTITKYITKTSGSIHSVDWLFMMSQSAYYLETGNVTCKTNAAKWVIQNNIFSCKYELENAIKIRKNTEIAKDDFIKEWLFNLGDVTQQACKELISLISIIKVHSESERNMV